MFSRWTRIVVRRCCSASASSGGDWFVAGGDGGARWGGGDSLGPPPRLPDGVTRGDIRGGGACSLRAPLTLPVGFTRGETRGGGRCGLRSGVGASTTLEPLSRDSGVDEPLTLADADDECDTSVGALTSTDESDALVSRPAVPPRGLSAWRSRVSAKPKTTPRIRACHRNWTRTT